MIIKIKSIKHYFGENFKENFAYIVVEIDQLFVLKMRVFNEVDGFSFRPPFEHWSEFFVYEMDWIEFRDEFIKEFEKNLTYLKILLPMMPE